MILSQLSSVSSAYIHVHHSTRIWFQKKKHQKRRTLTCIIESITNAAIFILPTKKNESVRLIRKESCCHDDGGDVKEMLARKIMDQEINTWNRGFLYCICHTLWIDWHMSFGLEQEGGSSLPWCWHILSIPLTTGRGTGPETCGLDDVFIPDDLCSHPEALC